MLPGSIPCYVPCLSNDRIFLQVWNPLPANLEHFSIRYVLVPLLLLARRLDAHHKPSRHSHLCPTRFFNLSEKDGRRQSSTF